jgi:hypothetical protein
MYRQGDILIVRVDEAPEGARRKAERGRLILARGEVTGHHHSVAVQDAELIDAGARGIFLRIMEATPLEHQEHGAITLQPGDYRVTRQREYVPAELPRQVAD